LRATDKEFFDHEINNGISPHNPDYYNLMVATSNIIRNYAHNIIEIGSGLGTLGEVLQSHGITYYGIEPNPYHREFALTRGIELHDLGNYPNHCEMIVSIEVLEHLTNEQINEYLENIQAKYFYLSSTPYTTTPEFDYWWGHINIKSVDQWIEFFGRYGYQVLHKLTVPTDWSILFFK
jgi:2-polyprenyl-3-methyl-5-hydroxy-6-metoxy-1,4-benzoquinol methylase